MFREKKNLDTKKHINVSNVSSEVNLNTQISEPVADLRISNATKNRKFESLQGRDILIEKQEITKDLEVVPIHDNHWEEQRIETIERAKRDALVAKRTDESAWTDEDGYKQIHEAPAFREGYNTTLRVLPSQEDHLHNGLKLQENNERMDSGIILTLRSKDVITRLVSQRGEISKLIGMYFLRGLQSGVFGDKLRDLDVLGGLRNEIELLLRNYEVEETPEGYVSEISEIEKQKRKEIIANAIGNAFLEIGMTLPAGTREDLKRNDVVAMNIGTKLMYSEDVQGHQINFPKVFESLRKEISIAIGRVMLHLRAAADIQASRLGIPVRDALEKDRTIKKTLGQLTLQFIENSTTNILNTKIRNDPKRKEILVNILGNIMAESLVQSTKSVPQNIQKTQFRNENVNKRPTLPTRPLPSTVERDKPFIEKRK